MSQNVLQGRQFHHFTNLAGAKGITDEGPRSSEYGSLGPGFYLTSSADEGKQYGEFQFSGEVAARNPHVTTAGEYLKESVYHSHPEATEDDYHDILFDDEAMDAADEAYHEHLKSLGHDSIHAELADGTQEVVLFNPRDFEYSNIKEH